MKHINYQPNVLGRSKPTAPEWLPLTRQITTLVNTWSNRSDLVAYVGEETTADAAALYTPAISEVEVSLRQAFRDGVVPSDIADLTKRSNQYEWAKATGCIFHEAMHARYSRWDIDKVSKELNDLQFRTLMLFEESRIESRAFSVAPDYANFLRASALEIAIGDAATEFSKQSSVRSAGMLVALVHSRVDAGILDERDVEAVYKVCEEYLGKEVIDKLRAILYKTRAHENDRDVSVLYPLVDEWIAILTEVAKEKGEDINDGPNPGDVFIVKASEALEEGADCVAVAVGIELSDQQSLEEEREELAKRYKASDEKRDHKAESMKVYNKSTGPGDSKTNSRLTKHRPPTPEERAAAVLIGNALEKAKYRERDVTEVSSILPPGRLRTRAAVQAAAQQAMGIRPTNEPWRRKARKHTDDPTLSVGVMVDISGSMGSAMEPMAATSWIMSEAAYRVQARYAQVYYGNDVFYSSKPGARQPEVDVYTASDGTEVFDKAFKVVDGAVNLLHGSGARLLVVVSDGEYTPEQTAKCNRWMEACKSAGVAVIWIPFDTYCRATRFADMASGATLSTGPQVEDVAKAIGKAATELLSKIGRRNAA